MTAVHREIATRYDVDGIFTNRWANQSECHCEHCRRNFRAFSGLDLPRTPDPADATRRAYVAWRRARLTELWDVWDADIRRARAGACFIPNGPPDLRTAAVMQAPIQFADYQARRGLTPPWSNGRRAKEYHAVMDGRPVGGIFSVGVEEPHRWKDSVQSEAEIRLWVADGTAHGMRPWFAKFAGVLRDRRWLPVVERIYAWHHRHERYLRNTRSLARVALLLSEQTAASYVPGPERPVADHIAGMLMHGGEGLEVAEQLNDWGISCFILTYRLSPAYNDDARTQDGLRAMQIVRARAAEWEIDPARIGFAGFSAGSALGRLVAAASKQGDTAAGDAIAKASSRPDFLVLVYSAGRATPGEDLKTFPPTFLTCAAKDTGPANGSAQLFVDLNKAGAIAEIHVYQQGRHGYGAAIRSPEFSPWMPTLRHFLQRGGFVPEASE